MAEGRPRPVPRPGPAASGSGAGWLKRRWDGGRTWIWRCGARGLVGLKPPPVPRVRPPPPCSPASVCPQELEEQYSPSRWSRRMDSESVIRAHIDVMTAGGGARPGPAGGTEVGTAPTRACRAQHGAAVLRTACGMILPRPHRNAKGPGCFKNFAARPLWRWGWGEARHLFSCGL